MKTHLRSDLDRRGIDHAHLTDIEAFHLSCALRGWHVPPRTAAGADPIDARVWLAAALSTGGRYAAPETPGHPADLRDGGPEIDSVILMAVLHPPFLPPPPHPPGDDSPRHHPRPPPPGGPPPPGRPHRAAAPPG